MRRAVFQLAQVASRLSATSILQQLHYGTVSRGVYLFLSSHTKHPKILLKQLKTANVLTTNPLTLVWVSRLSRLLWKTKSVSVNANINGTVAIVI